MPDTIGGITVTTPPVISAFPISVDWGGGIDYIPNVAVHVFDAPDLKTEQRFVLGAGFRRIRIRRDHMNKDEYALLKNHWLQAQGQYASFPIAVQGPSGMETWNVRYENPNVSFPQFAGMLTGDPGLTLLVLPDALPPYTSVATVTRFPDANLLTNLASQTQHVYPLLTIQDQVRNASGALVNQPNYFSNQRVQVDGKVYLPRLLTWNGITQTLSEASDSATFTLGNADDIFTQWANQVNLYRAAVQFSLYHAESGYIIQLWAGYARPWALDTTGRFVLPCSNGTYELHLQYPTRTITRSCWKVYKGRFCPSTSSLTTCPKDYNACVARGVPTSFGGVVVPHQYFRTRDSSTGVLGWGRSWMTSVTITNDTIYQNAIQEIYTDKMMKITAPIMGGRDENTYYAALGMVSDGPIGSYDSNQANHLLDGSPPFDSVRAPIRGVMGFDPADTNHDFLAISIAQPDGSGGITWDLPPPDTTYSGGLAFAEIRRMDAAGLQLAPLTDHAMQISVTKGVSGWVWTAPGARTWFSGLTNCVWIAVNVYLRALGLRVQPSNASLVPVATMEQYFDVNQAIAAAAICDQVVGKLLPLPVWIQGAVSPGSQTVTPTDITPIRVGQSLLVDTGTNAETVVVTAISGNTFTATFTKSHVANTICAIAENQFPFRGIIKDRKPVKDWLTEILNCCLGYWTMVNGKLWIGIRMNASVLAENAYNQSHIKLKTLQTTPLEPQFNWFTVQFGDEEFEWQLNNTTVYDIDHACFVGTPDSPQYMQGNMTLAGVSNLSQAARVCVTRLREEIGGLVFRDAGGNITSNEQGNARNFSFQTTILSLKTMVGDVISVAHPKVPGGLIKGRVQSWTFNPDFSIDIQAKYVTDSMYQYDVGPKPTDVVAPRMPAANIEWMQGTAWMPNMVGPIVDGSGNSVDPIYTDGRERTFMLYQDYFIAADGTWSPAIFVSGYLGINTFVDIASPRIADINYTGSGGQFVGGYTYYFCVVVYDSTGKATKTSNLAALWIPATSPINNRINFVLLPPNTGTWSSWELFGGFDQRTLARQDGANGAVPYNYTFNGPLHPYTYGLPWASAKYVQVGAKTEIHAGIAGMLVSSIPAGTTNQMQCNDFIGSTDNWNGRLVSVIGDAATGLTALLNYRITAFNSSTGTITVSPNCVIAGQPQNSVEAGDVLIVRSMAASVASGGTVIGDPMWNNTVGKNQFGGGDPTWAGLAIDAEKGNIMRVLRGSGQGQYSSIIGNDHTHVTLATPLTGLDSTSVMTIEEPAWVDTGFSSPEQVALNHTNMVQIKVPVENLANRVVLVAGFLNDGEGHLTDEQFAVMREIFVFGQPPTVTTFGPGALAPGGGPWTASQTDQTIRVDTSLNPISMNLPPLVSYAGRTLYIFNMGTNTVTINTYSSGGVTETFYDGTTSQTITLQGGTLKITSTGDYNNAVLRRERRLRET